MSSTRTGSDSAPLPSERIRRLFSRIPAVVYTCAPEKPFPTTFITENVLSLYGHDPRDVLADGEFWVKQMPPNHANSVRRKLARLDNEPVSLEYPFRRADRTQRWLRDTVTLVRDAEGRPIEIVGCIVDITDRKEVEASLVDANSELQAAEARLRSIAENAPAFILRVNRDGIIEYINRTVQYLSPKEVVGTSVYDWQPPGYREIARNALERVFATGEVVGYEVLSVGGEPGENAWYASQVAPVVVAGEVVSAIIISTDITVRKHAEELSARIRDLQAEVEHACRLSTIGEMTASVAHEMGQPLTAIAQFCGACSELLSPGRDLAEEAPLLRKYFRSISDLAVQTGQIVRSVRSYATKHRPEPVDLDVNGAVKDVLRILSLDASHRAVAIVPVLSDEAPWVRMDRVQLQQVLMNLIRNALEACEEGTAADPCVRLETSVVEGSRARVSVTDCGPGLPSEDPDRVFAPFFTTKDDGLGLGLAITRRIVEAGGGTLRASNGDCGAVFSFELPLIPPAGR